MVTPTINKRLLLQQFLIWWGVFMLFMMALMLIMKIGGREQGPDLHLITLTLECTAMGSFMAISHYYLLYLRFFSRKKYLLYILLTICFIGVFVLLDAVLFYSQIGREAFAPKELFHTLFVDFERVMMAYAPVALIYTISRGIQHQRTEMPIVKISGQTFLQQFLLWWCISLIFLNILMLIMGYYPITQSSVLRGFTLSAECAAFASFMAVSHYYWLFQRYFTQKKYLLYFVLLVCFVSIFILLDAILLYFQVGHKNFVIYGRLHSLFENFMRVTLVYGAVVLAYTASRNIQYRRKQRRIAKFAEHNS